MYVMQTTRGTSLNTTTRRCIWLFAAIGGVVWGLDQLTKVWAVAALSTGRVVDVIPGVFDLVLTRNPGAAFSLGTGLTAALSALAIVVVIVVIRAASRLRDTGWAIGLGCLLGGALGNLTDRILREPSFMRGHVIDFLHIHHWPVFNLADCAITVAAVIIIWRTWRGVGLNGKR